MRQRNYKYSDVRDIAARMRNSLYEIYGTAPSTVNTAELRVLFEEAADICDWAAHKAARQSLRRLQNETI